MQFISFWGNTIENVHLRNLLKIKGIVGFGFYNALYKYFFYLIVIIILVLALIGLISIIGWLIRRRKKGQK